MRRARGRRRARTRSTNTGSAHCRSSTTTTCGRSCGPLLEQPAKRDARLLRESTRRRLRVDPDRREHLDERPVRDPLAVREAAAAEHVRRVTDPLEEVGDEPRLADPGGPEEREEPARRVGDGVLVVAPETLPLALAPDERRLEPAGERGSSPTTSTSRNASTGSDLPLQHERLDRLDADGIADEQPRLGADERLAGSGRLLEPRGDVDRVPGHERLASPPTTTSPVLMPIRASSPCAAIAARISTAARTARSASSSCEIGNPEDRHDGVPDELLDRAAVALDDGAQIARSSAASARAAPPDRSTRRERSSRRDRRRGR